MLGQTVILCLLFAQELGTHRPLRMSSGCYFSLVTHHFTLLQSILAIHSGHTVYTFLEHFCLSYMHSELKSHLLLICTILVLFTMSYICWTICTLWNLSCSIPSLCIRVVEMTKFSVIWDILYIYIMCVFDFFQCFVDILSPLTIRCWM